MIPSFSHAMDLYIHVVNVTLPMEPNESPLISQPLSIAADCGETSSGVVECKCLRRDQVTVVLGNLQYGMDLMKWTFSSLFQTCAHSPRPIAIVSQRGDQVNLQFRSSLQVQRGFWSALRPSHEWFSCRSHNVRCVFEVPPARSEVISVLQLRWTADGACHSPYDVVQQLSGKKWTTANLQKQSKR